MVYPESWKCPNCHELVKKNKICPECKFKYSLHYPRLWNCPKCGDLVSESRHCSKCNYPLDLHYPELWHCRECGALVHSSTKCSDCGYSSRKFEVGVNPRIHSRLDFNDILKKRRDVFLVSVGIITLLGVLILLSIPSPVSSFNTNQVLSGESSSFVFNTGLSAESVSFEFTSPNGFVYSYGGVLSNNGYWIVPNLIFNESGNWSVVTEVNSFGATTELIDYVLVQPECDSNSDCSDSVCCFGTCVNVCESDDDCSDGLSYTVDTCVLPNSCEAKCVNLEVGCDLSVSDNYCPSGCSVEDDVDCTNCPGGQIMCNNECFSPCYSDNDCSDGNSSTFDECITSLNPCNSYCRFTPVYDVACPAGKIRVGVKCMKPACFTHQECDDGREGFAHKCYYPGTQQSYCYHQECGVNQVVCTIKGSPACVTPVCDSNSDCDAGAPNTAYYCMNHGSCNAYCITCENNVCSDYLSYSIDCNNDEDNDGLDERFSIEWSLDDSSIIDNDEQFISTSVKDSGVYVNYYDLDEVRLCMGDNYDLHHGSEYVFKFDLSVDKGVLVVISGVSSPGDNDYVNFEEGYNGVYELRGTIDCSRNHKVLAFYAKSDLLTEFRLDFVDLRINYKD